MTTNLAKELLDKCIHCSCPDDCDEIAKFISQNYIRKEEVEKDYVTIKFHEKHLKENKDYYIANYALTSLSGVHLKPKEIDIIIEALCSKEKP